MAGCVTRTDHRQLDRREQLSIIHPVNFHHLLYIDRSGDSDPSRLTYALAT